MPRFSSPRVPCRALPVLAACVAALSLGAPRPASAQEGLSVIAGATFAKLRGVDDADLDNRTGLLGGLSLVKTLSGAIAVQPEVLLVSKGAKGSGRAALNLNYLEAPLLLRLSLAPGAALEPHAYAGPYFGLKIRCRVDTNGTSADCDDVTGISTKSVDVGGMVGGGVTVGMGGLALTAGARYGFGISTVAEFDAGNVQDAAKNGYFALYVGLGFRGSK